MSVVIWYLSFCVWLNILISSLHHVTNDKISLFLWFKTHTHTHTAHFWDRLVSNLRPSCLSPLNIGATGMPHWAQLHLYLIYFVFIIIFLKDTCVRHAPTRGCMLVWMQVYVHMCAVCACGGPKLTLGVLLGCSPHSPSSQNFFVEHRIHWYDLSL